MPSKAFPYRTVAISPEIARRVAVAAAEAGVSLKEMVERSVVETLGRSNRGKTAAIHALFRPTKAKISKGEYRAISRAVATEVMRGRST